MTYDRLRKYKPLIVDVNSLGHPDPRLKGIKWDIPVKFVQNTKSDMDLLNLYSKGILKWENTGPTCGNCVNFYPVSTLGKGHGRCKARGFLHVHEDLAADDRKGYTAPDGSYFSEWPKCPLFLSKERLSHH